MWPVVLDILAVAGHWGISTVSDLKSDQFGRIKGRKRDQIKRNIVEITNFNLLYFTNISCNSSQRAGKSFNLLCNLLSWRLWKNSFRNSHICHMARLSHQFSISSVECFLQLLRHKLARTPHTSYTSFKISFFRNASRTLDSNWLTLSLGNPFNPFCTIDWFFFLTENVLNGLNEKGGNEEEIFIDGTGWRWANRLQLQGNIIG